MYVGVILSIPDLEASTIGIPHVCGGDPLTGFALGATFTYSPCMWG